MSVNSEEPIRKPESAGANHWSASRLLSVVQFTPPVATQTGADMRQHDAQLLRRPGARTADSSSGELESAEVQLEICGYVADEISGLFRNLKGGYISGVH